MGRYVGLTHNRHLKAGGVSSNILRTSEYESATGITTDSDNNVTEITLGESKYEEVAYNNVGLITSYIENIDGNSITYNILYNAAGIVTSIQELIPTIPTYTIAGIPTSISEGSTGIVTVQVTGVNPSHVLYWDITNPGDFTTSSGNFSLDSNLQGTISIGPLADQLTEGPETFVVRVRTGSTAGSIVTTSDPITINDTSNTPTFTLTPPTSIDEGSAGLITCTTTDIFDGTILYWDVVPTTDFSASDGSVTVNSNSADIYVTPDADQTTEGSETFQLKLYTDSARTVNVATSSIITINDSSQTPAHAFSNVPSSMNEGDTINLTVTTTNTPGGTALYWDIVGGSGVNSNDFAVYQGSITVNNNTSVVQITTTSDNSSSEGTETFQVRLFTDSSRTNQVAITNSITINDTSLSQQVVYSQDGTHSWTCPAGVTSVCVVCVGGGGKGGGGGGGGGGLGWKNNISVTPGSSYTVVVGGRGSNSANGGDSYFISTGTVAGYGGKTATSSLGTNNSSGGSYTGDGGGIGGSGSSSTQWGGGGGGAGGYSGNGGNAQSLYGSGGSGGGGGGGAGHSSSDSNDGKRKGGGGGGVGLLGQGSSGSGAPSSSYGGDGGYGGSGGTNGNQSGAHSGGGGGNYGGGSGGSNDTSGSYSGSAGPGAVRIIWGSGRSFPSNAGDT